ncbi:MAG: CRISPR-associated endonuclease Cas2 [Peptococcaceae bacterium]|nr:MAG: CRISPR-associated endonuclease Cas2 [Peptococcaceae bacterium]
MQTLVIYDIVEDKIRNRVAEACKDYGLTRIQWSAFSGNLNYNRRQELYLRLRRTLGKSEGNIQIYPICDKDLQLKKEIDITSGEKKVDHS